MPADTQLPEGTDHILDEDGADLAETADLPEDTEAVAADEEAQQHEPAAKTDESADATAEAKPRDGAGGKAETGASEGETSGDLKGMLFGHFEELRGQATDRAFSFAQMGKDRATGAIDDVVKIVEDAAGEIDAKIGTQYGDYARRAAETLGGFSESFKAKEVDALYADARELVRSSPAVAIGAAAALGFVVARLIRAGIPGTPAGDDKNAREA